MRRSTPEKSESMGTTLPSSVTSRPRGGRRDTVTPRRDSRFFTWQAHRRRHVSSSPARVELRCRADASKARNEFRGNVITQNHIALTPRIIVCPSPGRIAPSPSSNPLGRTRRLHSRLGADIASLHYRCDRSRDETPGHGSKPCPAEHHAAVLQANSNIAGHRLDAAIRCAAHSSGWPLRTCCTRCTVAWNGSIDASAMATTRCCRIPPSRSNTCGTA